MIQLPAAILDAERFEQNGGGTFWADFESLAAEQQMFHDMNSSTRDTPVSNLHHSCAQCRKLVLSAGHKNANSLSLHSVYQILSVIIFIHLHDINLCTHVQGSPALMTTYSNCHIHLHVYRCSIWLCLAGNWRLICEGVIIINNFLLVFY